MNLRDYLGFEHRPSDDEKPPWKGPAIAVGSLVGLALVAGIIAAVVSSSAKPSASPTSAPSIPASSESEGLPSNVAVLFDCNDGDVDFDGLDDLYSAMSQFPDEVSDCTATVNENVSRNPSEIAAIKAYGPLRGDSEIDALETLYEYCAASSYDDLDGANNASRVGAATTLCPQSPIIKWMKLYANKQLFSDGTYTVGKEIHPGTYTVKSEGTKISNCYWELTDKSGQTIENDFITGAPRVEVTIPASVYGFHSEGCGWWKPA